MLVRAVFCSSKSSSSLVYSYCQSHTTTSRAVNVWLVGSKRSFNCDQNKVEMRRDFNCSHFLTISANCVKDPVESASSLSLSPMLKISWSDKEVWRVGRVRDAHRWMVEMWDGTVCKNSRIAPFQ